MSSADRLQLYVGAEEIGDAHAEFVRDPASAIVLPFSQRSDVLFFLMNAVVLRSARSAAHWQAASAITIPSCFPRTGDLASVATFTSWRMRMA